MLELPDKGPLKSYIQYCQAGEILDKPIVTESDLLLALKNADHELLDFFKTSFFYSWDEANGENFNFKTTPLTNERRQEIYEILNINEELRKIFSENIKIAQSNNDQIFVNENQTPSWVDTDNWYYWSKYKDYLLNKYGPEEGLNIVRSIDDSSTKILNLLKTQHLMKLVRERDWLLVMYKAVKLQICKH